MNVVLVTGGAGYIGSHMVKALRRAGYRTVILDNLSEGHRTPVHDEELIETDLLDKGAMRAVIRRHRPQAICHFAASCSVAESVMDPLKYYTNNVTGTLNLLQVALEVGVGRFIFSSTAAVYGEPESTPITEEHSTVPINPYGSSKLIGERVVKDFSDAYGMRYVIFRYFNAAGANVQDGLGEDHQPETHLIPLALRAAMEESTLKVFGGDYPTRDGSCIRDYVHVQDLVEAHLLGLEYLAREGDNQVLNLGTANGVSVLEIVEAIKRVTGLSVAIELDERRPGDPARLVASSKRAHDVLNWKPTRDLDEIIRSTYDFIKHYPSGFPALESNQSLDPQPEPAPTHEN